MASRPTRPPVPPASARYPPRPAWPGRSGGPTTVSPFSSSSTRRMISAESRISAATASSRMWFGLVVPGIGTMIGSFRRSQARQSWAGVQRLGRQDLELLEELQVRLEGLALEPGHAAPEVAFLQLGGGRAPRRPGSRAPPERRRRRPRPTRGRRPAPRFPDCGSTGNIRFCSAVIGWTAWRGAGSGRRPRKGRSSGSSPRPPGRRAPRRCPRSAHVCPSGAGNRGR